MSKVPLVLATLVSLNALAWSSSTPWRWDESGRAGIYAPDESEDVANTEAFGPRLCLVRTGGASGFETLEARLADPVSVAGFVFEKFGLLLMLW